MSVRNSITEIRAVNFSRIVQHPETGEDVTVTSYELQIKRAGESGWHAIDVVNRPWTDTLEERVKD